MDKVKCVNPTKLKASYMSKLSPPEIVSYAGGATSIGGALTLTEVGVMIGIATALLTFIFNLFYMHRKDKREQLETDARLKLEALTMGAWLEKFGGAQSPDRQMNMDKK